MTDVFSQSELLSVSAPLETARGLPPRSFFDGDIFELERQRIFFDGWCAIGFSDLVAYPGDAMPVDFMGVPIALVRQQDGSLKTFHNAVAYDSAPVLVERVRGADRLVGCYHGFNYALDGRLQDTPYWSGEAECSTDAVPDGRFDLTEIASAEWGRIVFVNISGNRAADFQSYIAPLERELGAFDLAATCPGLNEKGQVSLWEEEAFGNWKTHHENACMNVYHENFVHDIYAKSPSVPRVVDGMPNFRAVDDQGVRGLAYTNEQAGETYLELPLPSLPRVAGIESLSEENLILSLYPNLYFTIIGAHAHATIVTPLDPEHVHLQSLNFFADMSPEVVDGEIIQLIEAAWAEAVEEDGRVIAAIQKTRRSPLAQPGHYAPFWDRSHYSFTQQVIADLQRSAD